MKARKISVTATGVVDLGEAGRDTVGRIPVQIVTAGGATWTATFRHTLDHGQAPLSTSSGQIGYTPRKSGTFVDGGTALADTTGADFVVDVYADGGRVGFHVSALTLGGGTVTLYVGPVAG